MKADSIKISDYETTFSSHINRHIKLFENYTNLSDEQKNAAKDWGKRFNLGNGGSRFKYAQYITEKALNQIQGKTESEIKRNKFLMEHIIPKTKYIIEPIIKAINKNENDFNQIDFISNIINQRLRICFTTKEEAKCLKNKISNELKRKFESFENVSEKDLFERYFSACKNDCVLKNQKIYKIKNITQDYGRFHIETEEMFILE